MAGPKIKPHQSHLGTLSSKPNKKQKSLKTFCDANMQSTTIFKFLHLAYIHRPLWSIKVQLYLHGISMLLEHLIVGFETAPPTTAEPCTTSVNIVCCWEVRLSFRQFVVKYFPPGMWHHRRMCAGHTAVFCGHHGRLRLRGASVPFWSVDVW